MRTERLESRLSDGRLYSESVLEYPYFFGEMPVETALNEEFAQGIAQRRAYYENEMDADERYQRVKEYGGDVDSQMPYYTRSTVTVGYNAHAVLSILRIDLNWGGGAHPYTEEMGRTLLHTGETLGYEDLLQGTERQRREVDEQYLTGTAASDKSLRYATFYLTQTGMHFYLNVGDAVERVEVELPFTDPEDYHISAYALLSGGEAPEQFSGYAGAVQRAMERLEGYGAGEGYLYDLDGDGTEELILVYPQQSAENIPIMSYCVYTLRGGEAVALLEDETLFVQAGGPWGKVMAVSLGGTVCLAAENGAKYNNTPPVSVGEWKIYGYENGSLVLWTDVSFQECYKKGDWSVVLPDESTAERDGAAISYVEYAAWVDSMQVLALADGNDGDYYPEDSGQPLPELLERLRG